MYSYFCLFIDVFIYVYISGYTSAQRNCIKKSKPARYPLVFAAAVRFEDGEVAVASEPWLDRDELDESLQSLM